MLDMLDLLGPSGRDFHTSIVFTYAFDFTLYDGLIRRALKRSGVLNQIVFCDLQCYDANLREAATTLYLGRQYSVTPVHQNGAFHPKMYLLMGNRHGRLLVGSGNTTVGGLISNAEVFGLFDYDATEGTGPHPALSQCFEFAQTCAKDSSLAVQRQIKNAAQAASWLKLPPASDGRTLLIGGPGRPPLLEQLRASLPPGKADGIVLCSSSFDRRLKGLQKVAEISKTKPICILQPDAVELDGKVVSSLGSAVHWRAFDDPYPKEQRRRHAKAHAKLYIFGHGPSEICAFGSANASEPALNSINTEALVVLPPRKKGETVKALGLDASVNGKNISKDLESRVWKVQANDLLDAGHSCLLLGATLTESGYRLTLTDSQPPKAGHVALSETSYGSPQASVPLEQDKGGWLAHGSGITDQMRFLWLTSKAGSRLSNTVAITFGDVAEARRGGSLGTKASKAIASMQDGSMLGTILFELLDDLRDFEVIRSGTGGRSAKPSVSAKPGETGSDLPATFFYTDSHAEKPGPQNWMGDRNDLDILASLVQPLTQQGRGHAQRDEDENYDDSKLTEEAERRQIDAKKGKATGEERLPVTSSSSEALERAIDRLVRRLDRAATNLEKSLADREYLSLVPPQAIARQIWMAHIAAFLASRVEQSEDGEDFVCLDPWHFASYVLRICRALIGSKAGGFLDKLPAESWEGLDGESLKNGLSLLWTCVVWAAAFMVHYYINGPGKEEYAESLAVVSAELVAARFVWKARKLGCAPDETDLERRFPARAKTSVAQLARTTRRVNHIVGLIEQAEIKQDPASLGTEESAQTCKGGTLVFNPKLGVTMLYQDAATKQFPVVNFSSKDSDQKRFVGRVSPVLSAGQPYVLFLARHEISAA